MLPATPANTAMTTTVTSTEVPTLTKNPGAASAPASSDPATAAATAPASPARNARDTPCSASAPRSRPTRISSARPETVSPNDMPRPSAGTTWRGATNGTITRSAAITSSQPPPIASAVARLRPRAYSTRDRLAEMP